MALRFVIIVFASIAFAGAAAAAPIDSLPLIDLGTSSVASVGADGTLTLADGRILRLAGIDLARGHAGRDVRAALIELIAEEPLILKGDGPAEDRYRRVVAQAFNADGVWLEGELLRLGLARVATTPDHCMAASALYAAERTARSHHIGLWGDPEYALRRSDEAARLIDTWQVVDGTVAAIETRHGAIDLRFGDDGARDLIVRVPAAIARKMDVDPATLSRRHVRVRGWIGKGVAPLITISHAEQIEIVGHTHQRLAEEQ